MQFTAVLALFAAGAFAQSTENVEISEFSVHKTGATGANIGTPDSVSFKLLGNDAQGLACSSTTGQLTSLPSSAITCSGSKYSFSLLPGADASSFGLKVSKEVSTAAGITGQGVIPVNCRAGGDSTEVCQQVQSPVTITIHV
ncbi:hypothetical protein F4804DRAFT_335434 [Jackrogersella minutella]|nr:hypothetical protein F4804DRAFT_335434 [Jackrogersella minutella]